MKRHPLRIDFGPDPEIRAFIRHTYSIEGMRGAKPPALADEQLKKVQPLCRKFEALMEDFRAQSWENVTSYLARHVCLISGLFCGGTKFAANFLNAMGVLTGHEQIFSHDSKFYLASMVATQYDVEVSGGIPPWISSLKRPSEEKQIDHLTIVRHPVDLVNSRYYFQEGGNVLELQRDICTQLELNIGSIPSYIWRIESEDDQLAVLDIFGKSHKGIEKARAVDRNSKKKGPPVITWANLINPLKEWAEDLGYDEKGLA